MPTLFEREKLELKRRIALRIFHLRKLNSMKQEDFADAVGLPNGKTVSTIETGDREVAPSELAKIADVFKLGVEYFYDPTMLIGEGRFSWRSKASTKKLTDYEAKASKWIGAWREANRIQQKKCIPFSKTIPLNGKSILEEARSAAESIVIDWELGPYPAAKLAEKAEAELDVLVLYVDTPKDISGAACWIKDFGTILINRNEAEGRRNFDLAHELFHLLTWQAMPPTHIETGDLEGRRPHVELLADNFAGALLMPELSVRALYARKGDQDLMQWLVETSSIFRVSVIALYWRLVSLRMINNIYLEKVSKLRSANYEAKIALPYSRKFLERINDAMNSGHMSFSYVANLLDLTRDELENLLLSYFPTEASAKS